MRDDMCTRAITRIAAGALALLALRRRRPPPRSASPDCSTPTRRARATSRRCRSMTPAIVKGLVEQRPFKSIVDLNKFLLEPKLTPDQAKEFYRKAFVPINLNTGTREEFMLIPGVGSRMAAEFAEYRPWKTWAQFDKEIGKYVGQQETDRFKQYVFIPPG